MTNLDLLKQKLSILASSGVLSDSAVNTIDETVKALDESEPVVHCRECNNRGTSDCPIEELCWIPSDDWYCADGERR